MNFHDLSLAELKEKAKKVVHRNYWTAIVVCFLIALLTGEFGTSILGIWQSEDSMDPDYVIHHQMDKKYGLIITNPPIRAGKKVVDQILTEAKDHLVKNGVLLVVIQKKQGAPSAKKLMTKIYGNCEILARDKGYYILMSTNN